MTNHQGPVERAVGVLDVLAGASADLGNNEIARSLGVHPSTVSRLLKTLVDAGLVRRVPTSGRFQLGPRLVELGNAALARIDLRQLARPHLLALTAATGETATLSVPDGETTITVDFVQSPSSVRSVAVIGRPSIPHATAVGKVFLAYGPGLPAGSLASYTPRTVTDRARLGVELEQIKGRGWAQAVGEREPDLNAVAAPVLDAAGTLVGLLGVQGPAARFDRHAMRAAADHLVAAGSRLALPQA